MSAASPPTVLVVGEAISAFMRYAGEDALSFHGPFPSGAPVIFAGAATRLGLRVELAAAVGDDVFGRQLLDRLTGHGVSPRLLSVDSTRPTSSVFVSYHDDGSRDFVFYVQSTAAQSVPPSVLDELPGPPDWLHISGSALAFGGATGETVWRAIEQAVEQGTPMSLDPNVRAEAPLGAMRERLNVALEHAAVVFASEGELESLGLEDSAVCERGVVLVRKKGAAGAVVTTSAGSRHVAAPTVHELDPDGAGDIFAAGYVAATLHGHPPEVATRVGCLVAAESVQVRGPLESPITHVSAYLGRLPGRAAPRPLRPWLPARGGRSRLSVACDRDLRRTSRSQPVDEVFGPRTGHRGSAVNRVASGRGG
jgi:tagatose kinase